VLRFDGVELFVAVLPVLLVMGRQEEWRRKEIFD